MVKLRQDDKGNFIARKRLPDDVRDQYGKQHGARHEAKFFARASVGKQDATKFFASWLVDIETRIGIIRATRDGTGVSLTPAEARKLAGEWYVWWTDRHALASHQQIEQWGDAVQAAIYCSAADVSEEDAEHFTPDELWRDRAAVRENVRPVLADIGETAQFLAAKGLVLTNSARDLFLDNLYEDLGAALKRLGQLRAGDYSPDQYVQRFPKNAHAPDSGVTPNELFRDWIAKKQPAPSTIENWRYVFEELEEHFPNRSAASILPEEADTWIQSRIGPERQASYVKKTFLTACRTVFALAVRQKRIPRNPFKDVVIELPKKTTLRPQWFYPEECAIILKAALAISDTSKRDEAAKRWVPWLCAYTGARPSEITQLRRDDVIERGGTHALRITPEAGTVKTKQAHEVPLHEHLIEQGFLDFVSQHNPGPLFYRERQRDAAAHEADPTKQRKKPWFQATQRLAAWVRSLGVADPHLRPNHAWRHTFKRIADRVGISERMSDYITGHASKSTGARYGAPTLEDMAEALKKFPRYSLE